MPPKGYRHTKETIEKIKAKRSKQVFSTETRLKMSKRMMGHKYNLGKHHTEDTKKRISKKMKGVKKSLETRRKMSAWQIGSGNKMWKGGITPISHRIRYSEKYKMWRMQVFNRDRFTCQECKQIGGDLEAHHKVPFCLMLGELKRYCGTYRLYERAMNYPQLWDYNNAVTLCKICHKKHNKLNQFSYRED